MRALSIAASSLVLAACAAMPTAYEPSVGPSGGGYSEYRLEPGRYRVTFRGGSGAPLKQVSDYALRRAADLTLQDGYDWFRIADRVGGVRPDNGPKVSIGGGSASFGRRSGVGVGLGTSFSLGGGPSLSETLEIVMGRGAPPRDADAYDARELRRHLDARA